MLYLGIDQHARQITISLGDGTPKKMHAFFQQLTREWLRRKVEKSSHQQRTKMTT
jgi:hypothetical protein